MHKRTVPFDDNRIHFDFNKWGILHAWHADSFWASVQTWPHFRELRAADPPGGGRDLPGWEDHTFVLDGDGKGNMHRLSVGPNDFTADIHEIDGRPIAKRGRTPGVTLNPRLGRVM